MYPFVSLSVILSTFLQLHATTSVYICSVSHWLPKFPAPRLSRNRLTYCRWSHLFQNVYLIMSLLCSQFWLLPLSSDWRPYSFIDISLSRYLSTHCHLSLSYWNIRFFTFICLFILAAQHVGSSFPDQGLNLHPCIDFKFFLFFLLYFGHTAFRILVPQSAIKFMPPTVEVWCLNHGTPGKAHWNTCTSIERQWHPTPVLLPGKSHGWRSLVGCIPWGR